jgi:hypothetical protein
MNKKIFDYLMSHLKKNYENSGHYFLSFFEYQSIKNLFISNE